MLPTRAWLPVLFLFHAGLMAAQAPPDPLQQAVAGLDAQVRDRPPAEVLRRADSLLALPQLQERPRLVMAVHSARGKALRFMRKHHEAIEAQARAFALADSLGDDEGRKDAQLAIAIMHVDLRENDRARRELQDLVHHLEGRPAGKDYRIPLALAAVAQLSAQPDSALHWYQRALRFAEEATDSTGMANVLFNMSVLEGARQTDDERERILRRTLQVLPAGGYPQMEARASAALARLQIKRGRLDEVPALLDKAERIALQQAAGDVVVFVREYRVDLYKALGQPEKALAELERAMRTLDSVSAVTRERELADAQARLDVSRMEKELALTKAEAEVNALRAQRSRIAWGALAVIAVLAAALTFNFRRQYLAKKRVAVLLEKDKDRLAEENELLHQENLMARFETLKSQIDPHFLFNAMNTLYTLVETEPAKAREFIASFSALYRKVLTSRERTIVPLKEELELVHHYLFLQRIRFGESLRVNVDVPAAALGRYLPPFTLQMLLENAVKHNVISAAHPLHIHIGVEGDRLVVRNDLRPRGTAAEGTGTGLENIRRRYAMLGAPEPIFAISDPHYRAAVPLLTSEP